MSETVDSDAARAEIFASIARANAGQRECDVQSIATEAAALIAEPAAYQPQFADQSEVERFVEKATSERVTATVSRLAGLEGLPAALAAYLREHRLAASVALQPQPALQALDWGEIECHDTIAPNEPVSLCLADYGVAETGSLVLLSRPEAPTLFSFFPLYHLIVLERARILRYMEDFWEIMDTQGEHPRNINIITGTSGTADIEAKNIRGAHGPRYMHVFLSDESVPAGARGN